MTTILTIVASLFILIIIHEAGHAFFARLTGAIVSDFVVGRGKTIFKYGVFQLRLNLLGGGFCRITGVDNLSVRKQSLVILGGTIFNLVFALLLIFILSFTHIPFYFSIGSDMHFLHFIILVSLLNVVEWIPANVFGVVKTDGYQLFSLLKKHKKRLVISN